MSRSDYNDDCENWELIRWRGAVTSAIKGRRGQAFLKEILVALDALPVKQLIANALQCGRGVCVLGSVGLKRGMKMDGLSPEDSHQVAKAFGIAEAMTREIVFVNDEDFAWHVETPEDRFKRVRAWVVEQIAGSNSVTPPRKSEENG